MTNITVKRIDTPYVADDCVQVMLGFSRGLIIEDTKESKVLFSIDSRNHGYKNSYIEDQRKEQFPYHNIPVHREIVNFHVRNFTNQILEFGKTYKLTYLTYDILGEYDSQFSYDRTTYYASVIKDVDGTALLVTSSESIPELRMSPEQLKHLQSLNKFRITPFKEPKIARILNRDVKKEDVEKAKRLIKEKKEKSTSY